MKTIKILLIRKNNNSGSDKDIKECNNKLAQIYKERSEGAKVRSRSRWWEEGEKSTTYFHGLEKKNDSDEEYGTLKNENKS